MIVVIVESPTKAKTIQRFLKKDFKVLSSFGHIRDLPKTKFGVDIERNFEPHYVILPKAKKIIKILREEVKKGEKTILATDEDREGEAIAYHLKEVLNLNGKPYERIVFHEITKRAIEQALLNPRKIDMNLVASQQARRILDRIVGYKLSPLLWKKVARKLSAGRVQSVALRLIVDREKEIENFVPQEYWKIIAFFEKENIIFQAFLSEINGRKISKLEIKTKKEANEILRDLKKACWKVKRIKKEEKERIPPPPFITSSLQQTCWQKFHYSASFTMKIAQNLYERGFITYHRTDSFNLSELSLSLAKKYILENLGEKYWAGFFRKYQKKIKASQEAHEAIRPTFPEQTPERLKDKLDKASFKIYDLIWRRFIASQMSKALFEKREIEILAEGKEKKYIFKGEGEVLKFEGFLKIYPLKFEEKRLPSLKENEKISPKKLLKKQYFTQPPKRYTEASLIKVLEKEGIGRPSTYAPILSTIQERNYVKKDKRGKFYPTEIGRVVSDLLVTHFPEIVDIKFTANMEKDLDEIARGKIKWQKVIEKFYFPFEKKLKEKEKILSKKEITEEKTKEKCPECGAPLIIKLGRFGKFYSCSRFPKCKYKASLNKKRERK